MNSMRFRSYLILYYYIQLSDFARLVYSHLEAYHTNYEGRGIIDAYIYIDTTE